MRILASIIPSVSTLRGFSSQRPPYPRANRVGRVGSPRVTSTIPMLACTSPSAWGYDQPTGLFGNCPLAKHQHTGYRFHSTQPRLRLLLTDGVRSDENKKAVKDVPGGVSLLGGVRTGTCLTALSAPHRQANLTQNLPSCKYFRQTVDKACIDITS